MTTNPLVPLPAAGPAVRPAPEPKQRPSNAEIAAWILVAALIGYVLVLRLVGAVVGGLALYVILDRLAGSMSKRVPGMAARTTAVILVTLIGGGVIFGVTALTMSFVQRHVGAIPAMMRQMAEILRSWRLWLGGYGRQIIPDFMIDAESFKFGIVQWLKGHADALKIAGGTAGLSLLHVIMGMLLAIVVFFRHISHHDDDSRGPLAYYLTEKVDRLAQAFVRIASAQIRVSVLNTAIIGVYLLALLFLGRRIPFMTTLIVLTFLVGLIPIVGNVVSNAALVILSLGVSGGVAITSLIFVVALSKLQYVLTSKMVGGEIDSQAWEILFAIIIGEAAFGISGVVLAPIVYAFVKHELRERALV
ncbi:MAG TPA: AI-2E family transporter [Thermoanaerobaculia bacterium]|nr:AI-2E family transporter [Thermoanaerobaculia bacterium]